MNRRLTGARGETEAVKHLIGRGYVILERNYSKRMGEIDIVARDGEYLVFCEVKFRRGDTSGCAAAAVDFRKQRQICHTALYYLKEHRVSPDQPIRFDVVAMDGDRVELIRNAFDYVL